jgi:hypothetical protein
MKALFTKILILSIGKEKRKRKRKESGYETMGMEGGETLVSGKTTQARSGRYPPRDPLRIHPHRWPLAILPGVSGVQRGWDIEHGSRGCGAASS